MATEMNLHLRILEFLENTSKIICFKEANFKDGKFSLDGNAEINTRFYFVEANSGPRFVIVYSDDDLKRIVSYMDGYLDYDSSDFIKFDDEFEQEANKKAYKTFENKLDAAYKAYKESGNPAEIVNKTSFKSHEGFLSFVKNPNNYKIFNVA